MGNRHRSLFPTIARARHRNGESQRSLARFQHRLVADEAEREPRAQITAEGMATLICTLVTSYLAQSRPAARYYSLTLRSGPRSRSMTSSRRSPGGRSSGSWDTEKPFHS